MKPIANKKSTTKPMAMVSKKSAAKAKAKSKSGSMGMKKSSGKMC
jgi:hypothetical protein